ncbi:MAG: cupin domain-containing protein [Coleofasciculus sp. D1-CHI-01]|uniref:cupin domain-containing protein n=1 Tax=Coleofasciculus sp. D1-CHI-01 TaxID=3068482 RepID=UPI0033000C68
MSIKNAGYWIEKLGLQNHPEGGYYKETYRSDEAIAHESLPKRFSGRRNLQSLLDLILMILN